MLWLHILVEALVGLAFLVPGAVVFVPGMADGNGTAYFILLRMYGWAAMLLAALGVVAYLQMNKAPRLTYGLIVLLAVYHFGLTFLLLAYHPDQRAALLHFFT
ncbi:MAG: hypothetical protein HC821_03435, partial [Lewinella sp.]|nr:hypothetical protein [Lewinella sp.]